MAFEIRRLTPQNAALLEVVAEDVFDEPIVAERLRAYVAEPGHVMFLALDAGVVVGQAAAVIHLHPDKPTELYIDEVGVAPAWQRGGIGRALVERLLALGREIGCEEAWLGTEHDNVPARALYETQGVEAEPFVMYLFEL